MPTVISGLKFVGGILGSIAFDWLAKLATKEVFEYIILEAGKAYVKSTKTEKDDVWFAQFESIVTTGELPKG